MNRIGSATQCITHHNCRCTINSSNWSKPNYNRFSYSFCM